MPHSTKVRMRRVAIATIAVWLSMIIGLSVGSYLFTIVWEHDTPTCFVSFAVQNGRLLWKCRTSSYDYPNYGAARPCFEQYALHTHMEKDLTWLGLQYTYHHSTLGPGLEDRFLFGQLHLWIVFIVVAAGSGPYFFYGPFRRRRRKKRGLCAKCGYDLTGNVSEVCPECGCATGKKRGHH